jgi:GNAT superfamily N-acetyltransferase
VQLGPLLAGDRDAGLALGASEGWNQTAADWARMTALEPDGCFAARDGERLVGTVTTTTYGHALAWIGMMLVHPDYRRRGIGAGLMRLALDHLHALGVMLVKLDATPAGRPLYESLGFSPEAELERWQGTAPGGAGRELHLAAADTVQGMFALDRSAYGADRSRLLETLLAESAGGPLIVESEPGVPAGFALARRGRAATYIGPVVATTADAAVELLDGMLARFGGEDVCIDVHTAGLLRPAALAERGLTRRRALTRMHHTPLGDAETPPSVCASAGPEFG